MPTRMPFFAISCFLPECPRSHERRYRSSASAPQTRVGEYEGSIPSFLMVPSFFTFHRQQSRPQAALLRGPIILSLGVLAAASRLVQAHLLALDLARVARHQARLLEHGLQG